MEADLSNDAVRRLIETDGTAVLTISDLRSNDLGSLTWVDAVHLDAVAKVLARATGGEVVYLAVRDTAGDVIAKGGIDFAKYEGVGTIWQVMVRHELRSMGVGTALVAALEERARRRPVDHVVLGVEDNNPRALALYERLGYVRRGREAASWLQAGPHGEAQRYETEITLLGKPISPRRRPLRTGT